MLAKRWTVLVDGEVGSLWACTPDCAEAAADAQGGTLDEFQGESSPEDFCEGGSLCPQEEGL